MQNGTDWNMVLGMGGLVIALAALAFTVASFWWLNARRGRIEATTPRSYAFATRPAQTRLRLPLAFHNTGATPLVITDLRLLVEDDPHVTSFPWETTRDRLRPEREDGFRYATPFAVPGRGVTEVIVEFGAEGEWPVFPAQHRRMRVEASVHPAESWAVVTEFDWWAPPMGINFTQYLAHRNDTAARRRTRRRRVGFGDITSGWWYWGRLRPIPATRFNVQEIAVRRGVRIEVFHDVIALWSKPGPGVVTSHVEARELFGIVLGAYALITETALDLTLEGWIEATNASFEGTVFGNFVDTRGHDPSLSPRSRRSVDMRRACRLAIAVSATPGYRIALRDIHSAMSVGGDDSFVYAYRAVEDLARAVSGRRGELRGSDWSALHVHLGTDETRFKDRIAPLQTARRAAAHGDETDVDLIAARNDRTGRIGIARSVVADALSRDPALRFANAHVR